MILIRAKVENESERKTSFTSLEIVNTRDIEKIRDNIILSLNVMNLEIVLI